ncbi:MAG: glutamate-1-semialdehyde 2,1-aminomutase [Thermoanaerobaculia bacterium]|nr:glutamate-1-semialdehyde 2,1-aminomutase [Thermoanaerobaculia bacterium]
MSLFDRAQRVIPGGVNSPVRAFRGVGGEPRFIRHAEGAWIVDEEGRRYVDYIGGYGPMIVGHRHPDVEAALSAALTEGVLFGAPTAREVELAELIASALPSIDMVRLVNSGTEATMSALRLARAATGRSKLIKFVGCYHGHADAFLVAAGSGAATLGVPSSPGVPPAVVADTLTAPYNDLEAVAQLMEQRGEDIAAIFIEPIAGNMSLVPPAPGFLEGLRRLCDDFGALLVFDEVMTGFRVAWDSAQGLTSVVPDLTTLGKVIGGGLPIGAYGGRRDLMEQIAPSGPVYQAGTLSGNPLATAAGLATLRLLAPPSDAYQRLERTAAALETGIRAAADRHGVDLTTHRRGSMLGLFLTDGPVVSSTDVDRSDRASFSTLFHQLLATGVHLPPSPYETLFVSLAHDEEAIVYTLAAFDTAFSRLSAARPGN